MNDSWNLLEIFDIWRRRWRYLVLGLVVGLLVSVVWRSQQEPLYRAEAVVMPVGNEARITAFLALDVDTLHAYDEQTQLMLEILALPRFSEPLGGRLSARRTAHYNVKLGLDAPSRERANADLRWALRRYDTLKSEILNQRSGALATILLAEVEQQRGVLDSGETAQQHVMRQLAMDQLALRARLLQMQEGLVLPQSYLLDFREAPGKSLTPSWLLVLLVGGMIGLMGASLLVLFKK